MNDPEFITQQVHNLMYEKEYRQADYIKEMNIEIEQRLGIDDHRRERNKFIGHTVIESVELGLTGGIIGGFMGAEGWPGLEKGAISAGIIFALLPTAKHIYEKHSNKK